MSEPFEEMKRFLKNSQRDTVKKRLKEVVLTAGGRTLGVNGLEFLQKLMATFEGEELPVTKAYLVGGFATYLMNTKYRYNDYDIAMPVELKNPSDMMEEQTFTKILNSVKELIRRSLQESDSQDCEGTSDQYENLVDQFITKKFRFNKLDGSTDSWSLLSLKAANGIDLELKFILSLARKYEFITDSVEVDLMPLLNETGGPMPFRLLCEGDINQNLKIVRKLKIKTFHPEKISGGGLLKYCRLKSEGCKYYHEKINEATIIPPMARGFFARYGNDVEMIRKGILNYIAEHFKTVNYDAKMKFLDEIKMACNSIEVPNNQHSLRSAVFEIIEELKSQETGASS
ncbi:unnamed protein product [Caenorhabditis brenneri]